MTVLAHPPQDPPASILKRTHHDLLPLVQEVVHLLLVDLKTRDLDVVLPPAVLANLGEQGPAGGGIIVADQLIGVGIAPECVYEECASEGHRIASGMMPGLASLPFMVCVFPDPIAVWQR